ncbi:phage tail fiber protein [Proteus vulgaris]|uniref:phage tail fiber protein n=1 Tax=Proteus vulgaris TaxID=585 RepID=UPI000657939D|nr:hypothetical protein [Proteus vulgaris]CRL61905.1 hypothetical protein BN1805_01491 [Proteus vulgaris]
MIYTTGTVNTVSGSAIVKGTGTKFKNNNPAINIGMTILIKSGNTNIPYMIKSVNSDTELVLAQPALATATNTTFSIHITEPDNNSDAARTMVAINSYVEYFLDAMNTWMTQTGKTKIEMPNGEIVTLDSIKKMQGDIANKLDTKKGGIQRAEGELRLSSAIGVVNNNESNAAWISLGRGNPDIYVKREGATNCIYTFPDPKLGNRALMGIGDYGIGGIAPRVTNDELKGTLFSQFMAMGAGSDSNHFGSYGGGISIKQSEDASLRMFVTGNADFIAEYYSKGANVVRSNTMWGTRNTTTDPQGFIKKASPIVNINSDGTFITNDESEGATVTRVAQGEYLIEGVLGFNADAGWGGVDGGIEIPLDVNKQPLIWVNSKVNKDGSILVKTYHRTHPNAPDFARNDLNGFNDGDPIDIPDGRFISVRVQMPEQSIYNVRMREMEEAQKAEEERRQKEEEENQDTNSAPEIDN